MFSIISTIFGGHRRRNNNYDSNNNNNAYDPLGLDIWDPFKDFPFNNNNNNNNNSVFFSTQLSNETAQFANTRIDWKKTPEAHVFTANLPGIRKEEVKVEVEEGGRVLKISGHRKKVLEEKKDNKWHRMECSSGKFLHRFRLPENAMVDQMKVTMDNGVLIITIPKSSKVFEEK